MDDAVRVTVVGESAEQVGRWLDRLREVGLVPAQSEPREYSARPGVFLGRAVPDQASGRNGG